MTSYVPNTSQCGFQRARTSVNGDIGCQAKPYFTRKHTKARGRKRSREVAARQATLLRHRTWRGLGIYVYLSKHSWVHWHFRAGACQPAFRLLVGQKCQGHIVSGRKSHQEKKRESRLARAGKRRKTQLHVQPQGLPRIHVICRKVRIACAIEQFYTTVAMQPAALETAARNYWRSCRVEKQNECTAEKLSSHAGQGKGGVTSRENPEKFGPKLGLEIHKRKADPELTGPLA